MKSFILFFRFCFVLCTIRQTSFAATFVGNGGNAGDIELSAAQKEIKDTLRILLALPAEEDKNLCKCMALLEGHAVCDLLQQLTPPQQQVCAQFLKDNAGQLSLALDKAQITWSNDSIQVKEGQTLREVDAVTDYQTKKITLSHSRFMEMTDYERVFLLTHELGHLIAVKGKPIDDLQTVEAFEGADGGRKLLNAAGAGLAMLASDNDILRHYLGALKRSRGHKQSWIDFSTIGQHSSNEDQFAVQQKGGAALRLRYQLNDAFGVWAQFHSQKGSVEVLSQIHGNETNTASAAGVSYRHFFFRDPLTFWGQSFAIASFGLEHQRSKYELEDAFLNTSTEVSSSSYVADLGYMLPLQSNFWLFVRVGSRGHKYKIELPFRTIEMNPSVSSELGVSYGF